MKSWWEYYENLFYKVFVDLGVNKKDSYKMSLEVKKEYSDITKWNLYDDTLSTLEECKRRGYNNYILSNHIPELSEIIKGLKMDTYLDGIFCSGLIGYEKPNKKIYDYALSKSKEAAVNIMIGDNYNVDILGAEENSIIGILIRNNNDNAKYFIKDLSDVFLLIDKIIS